MKKRTLSDKELGIIYKWAEDRYPDNPIAFKYITICSSMGFDDEVDAYLDTKNLEDDEWQFIGLTDDAVIDARDMIGQLILILINKDKIS